jgi:hypothetical protein
VRPGEAQIIVWSMGSGLPIVGFFIDAFLFTCLPRKLIEGKTVLCVCFEFQKLVRRPKNGIPNSVKGDSGITGFEGAMHLLAKMPERKISECRRC